MREAQTDLTLIARELADVAELCRALPVQFRQVFILRKVYGSQGLPAGQGFRSTLWKST